MINTILIICLVILSVYCLCIALFTFFFIKKDSKSVLKNDASISISIIIAARNEENNIEVCLNSILQSIAKSNTTHQIIVIDDNSTDGTLAILNKYKLSCNFIQVIELAQHKLETKKQGIQLAAKMCKNDWLLFTDADCLVNENWIAAYQNKIANSNAMLIAGPVTITPERGFLNAFQTLDMFSMTGTARATINLKQPILCNMANLAVKKSVFIEATTQNDFYKKASGDDIYLLFYVLKKYGASAIVYLKSVNAIVQTKMQSNWSDLWSQRKRWVSKSAVYSSKFMTFISLLVYFSALSIMLLLALSLTLPEKKTYFFFAFIAKSIIDFIFLFVVANFFKSSKSLIWFIPVKILHVVYICIVPLFSINSSYIWKGRRLK